MSAVVEKKLTVTDGDGDYFTIEPAGDDAPDGTIASLNVAQRTVWITPSDADAIYEFLQELPA